MLWLHLVISPKHSIMTLGVIYEDIPRCLQVAFHHYLGLTSAVCFLFFFPLSHPSPPPPPPTASHIPCCTSHFLCCICFLCLVFIILVFYAFFAFFVFLVFFIFFVFSGFRTFRIFANKIVVQKTRASTRLQTFILPLQINSPTFTSYWT